MDPTFEVPTSAVVPSPWDEHAALTQGAEAKITQPAPFQANAGQQALNVLQDQTLYSAYEYGKAYLGNYRDPNYTKADWQAAFDTVKDTLPEEYHPMLYGATSEKGFWGYYELARERHRRASELADGGAAVSIAHFGATVLDPVGYALFSKAMKVSDVLAKTLKLGRAGTQTSKFAYGAAAGVGYENARGTLGHHDSPEAYAAAVALGGFLSTDALAKAVGGVKGISRELFAIRKAHKKSLDSSIEAASRDLEAASAPEVSESAVKRAYEGASAPKPTGGHEPIREPEAPAEPLNGPFKWGAKPPERGASGTGIPKDPAYAEVDAMVSESAVKRAYEGASAPKPTGGHEPVFSGDLEAAFRDLKPVFSGDREPIRAPEAPAEPLNGPFKWGAKAPERGAPQTVASRSSPATSSTVETALTRLATPKPHMEALVKSVSEGNISPTEIANAVEEVVTSLAPQKEPKAAPVEVAPQRPPMASEPGGDKLLPSPTLAERLAEITPEVIPSAPIEAPAPLDLAPLPGITPEQAAKWAAGDAASAERVARHARENAAMDAALKTLKAAFHGNTSPQAGGILKTLKDQAKALAEMRAKDTPKATRSLPELSPEEVRAIKDRLIQAKGGEAVTPKELREAVAKEQAQRLAILDDHPDLPRSSTAREEYLAGHLRDPKAMADLEAGLHEAAQKMLPKGWKLATSKSSFVQTKKGAHVFGFTRPEEKLIMVAMGNVKPWETLYHEVVHAIKNEGGLFTESEWKTLVTAAKEFKSRYWPMDRAFEYKALYGERPDLFEEEMVAHMLGERGNMHRMFLVKKGPLALMDRLFEYLKYIKDAIIRKPRLKQVFDDFNNVFHKINDGAYSNRSKAEGDFYPEPSTLELASLGEYFPDGSLNSVKQEQSPQGPFPRWMMITRGGYLSKVQNALERAIGTHLLVPSAGLKDARTPFTADQEMARLNKKYTAMWNQTLSPAYKEWADGMNLTPYERTLGGKFTEFSNLVGERITDRVSPAGTYHPAVERAAAKGSAILKDLLELAKNPRRDGGGVGKPIDAAALVPEDQHYLSRVQSHQKWTTIGSELAGEMHNGETIIDDFWASAIHDERQGTGLDWATALTVGKGYVRTAVRNMFHLGDDWSIALATGNREALGRIMADVGIGQQEIETALTRLLGGKSQEGGMENLRHRTLLNESFTKTYTLKDGSQRTLRVSDFIEKDADAIIRRYTRRMSGRIALGDVKVTLPDGTVIQDGFSTRADMTRAIENVKNWGAHHGHTPDMIEASAKRLQWAFDAISGLPQPHSDWNFAMRMVRGFETMTRMGQVGINQIGETTAPIAELGLKSVFSHIPSMKRLLNQSGDMVYTDPLLRDLESITGVGSEALHGYRFTDHDWGPLGDIEAAGNGQRKALQLVKGGEQAIYDVSMQNWVQRHQTGITEIAILNRLGELGANLRDGIGLSKGDAKRMAYLNIDEAMLNRIFKELQSHTVSHQSHSWEADLKMHGLDLNSWTDLGARATLEKAIFRGSRKLIQTGDLGSMMYFMDQELAKTLLQFRGYGFTAWENQFLYNIHVGDLRAYLGFATAITWNAAVRAAQITLLSATRSDGQEYRDKNLTTWGLAKAGFQRAGFSSILPMITDTILTPTTGAGMFDARSSGQPSHVLFGSAPIASWDMVNQGLGGTIRDLYNGNPVSQTSARNLFGAIPGNNTLPATLLFSYLIKDQPKRSPKIEQTF